MTRVPQMASGLFPFVPLILFSSLIAACSTDFIDPMEEQKKGLPFKENPFFSDGRMMRPLVEGTVPRERFLGDPLVREGVAEGRFAERIPIQVTLDLLHAGKKRFEITCAPCHGFLGDGDSVVARKMALRPPPSLVSGRIADYPPGRVFRAITEGYGLMPSYAPEVPIEERWATVGYLAALKLSRGVPLDSVPPEIRSSLLKGKP